MAKNKQPAAKEPTYADGVDRSNRGQAPWSAPDVYCAVGDWGRPASNGVTFAGNTIYGDRTRATSAIGRGCAGANEASSATLAQNPLDSNAGVRYSRISRPAGPLSQGRLNTAGFLLRGGWR